MEEVFCWLQMSQFRYRRWPQKRLDRRFQQRKFRDKMFPQVSWSSSHVPEKERKRSSMLVWS